MYLERTAIIDSSQRPMLLSVKLETRATTVRNAFNILKSNCFQDFPGGLIIKTSRSRSGSVGLISGWRAETPYAKKPKHETEATL